MGQAVQSVSSDLSPSHTARSHWSRLTDPLFRYAMMLGGLIVVGLIFWIGIRLYFDSSLTRHRFGWSLVRTSTWDVPREIYGALPFIYGTLVTSALALLIVIPIGVGAAVFLSEIAPRWLATPISFLIELLAAIPSVIYGLWGFLVLCPLLQDHISPWLVEHFGSLPIFAGPPVLTNILAAGLILAIMILPFVTSVSREVLRTVPVAQREASLALGATKWETIRSVVLRAARGGIVGAIILGLGRAIGETMAVVMVIGNTPQISTSLLQSGYSMPALLANQFNEAYNDDVQRSALLEVALILFVITLLINGFARLLLLLTSKHLSAGQKIELPIVGRLREWVGIGAKYGIISALVIGLCYQIRSDVRAHGLHGLFGPIEAFLLAYLLIHLISFVTRGTPYWLRWRKLISVVMQFILFLCAFVACSILTILLLYVAVQGVKGLSWHLFTELPRPPGVPGGGMKNAIVGTLELVAIAGAIGIPTGLMGGIFLAEFRQTRLSSLIRFAADVLNGIPSVVIGLFAYAAFVIPFKHFSAMAGGAALGIMTIPTIVRTTEEMLRLVPASLREASLSLGATHAQTIRKVILPAARSGIITGIMLAIARIAGETAPLLFTAFGSDELSTKLSEPVSSLTMKIYQYAISPYQDWIDQAWAAALVLLVLILLISLATRFATRGRYAIH